MELSRLSSCQAVGFALQVGANRWEYDHAKLEGSFRKLAAPTPLQFDEEAYTEALAECLEATKRFVMHTAWVSGLPPVLRRSRLCAIACLPSAFGPTGKSHTG